MLASLVVALVVTSSADASSQLDQHKTYDVGSGVVLVCAGTKNSAGGFDPHDCDVQRDGKVVASHLDIFMPEYARASKSGAHLFSVRRDESGDEALVITDLATGQSTQGQPSRGIWLIPSPDGARAILNWMGKNQMSNGEYERASYLMDLESGASRLIPTVEYDRGWSRDSSSFWWETRGLNTKHDVIFLNKVGIDPKDDAIYPIQATWNYVFDIETGLVAWQSLACVADGCRGANDLLVQSIHGGAVVKVATQTRDFKAKWLPNHKLEYRVATSIKSWSPSGSMVQAP